MPTQRLESRPFARLLFRRLPPLERQLSALLPRARQPHASHQPPESRRLRPRRQLPQLSRALPSAARAQLRSWTRQAHWQRRSRPRMLHPRQPEPQQRRFLRVSRNDPSGRHPRKHVPRLQPRQLQRVKQRPSALRHGPQRHKPPPKRRPLLVQPQAWSRLQKQPRLLTPQKPLRLQRRQRQKQP